MIYYPLLDMSSAARLRASASLLVLYSSLTFGQQVEFARDVDPILRTNCRGCHGERQQMSGLRLDHPEAALAGAYSGPVIKPGNSAGSRLIQVVSGEGKVKMPPAGPGLKPEQIATLRRWIDQGAIWPATLPLKSAVPARGGHWSYQPILRPELPPVKGAQFVRNAIDAFVAARLEHEQIAPSEEADRRTLVRRVGLDLIGLPPTPAEVEAFVTDSRPDAYERVVDRLLRSPHYGEKWARHWLDLARYADSDGYEKDLPRPYAWRWRKWVIDALNDDQPFDQFTIDQIAGDLLPNSTVEQRVATGFHRNSLTNREGGIDREQLRVEQAVDRNNTVGSVWLGLTVGCAQCHDHKYDRISQKEYYQLFAFFSPAEDSEVEAPLPGEIGPYLRSLAEYQKKRRELIKEYGVEPLQQEWEPKVIDASRNPGQYGGDWDLAWTVLWNDERKILLKKPSERTRKEADKLTDHFLEWYSAVVSKQRYTDLKFKELRDKLAKLREAHPALTEAPAITNMQSPPKAHVLIRGDFQNPGIEVQPGVLAVLNPFSAGTKPNRLDLARWIVAKENPLTARVAVNRMWQAFFGRGLISTSSDFGTQGERPTHPELLDWLAAEFQEGGWSVKHMHKLIVESATYRQSSQSRKDLENRDTDNRLLARQSRIRLEAELLRDSALSAGGLLEPSIGGPSIRPPQPAGLTNLGYGNFVKWPESTGSERYRRGLYIFFQRTVPYPQLMMFDAPDSNVSCPKRERSTTPLQALNLLNDPVFFEAAQSMAAGLWRENLKTDADRLDAAFRLALGRLPSAQEKDRMLSYLDLQRSRLRNEPKLAAALFAGEVEGASRTDLAAWVALTRAILNLDEFLTRE